eukprot:c4944_g2_i1.p1 GENE.c4944_g2_i1~~c4944_g2_i1.p1  ORF type:complete len:184 (+),score=17.59 c4944_g2_i1:653-1204(+)
MNCFLLTCNSSQRPIRTLCWSIQNPHSPIPAFLNRFDGAFVVDSQVVAYIVSADVEVSHALVDALTAETFVDLLVLQVMQMVGVFVQYVRVLVFEGFHECVASHLGSLFCGGFLFRRCSLDSLPESLTVHRVVIVIISIMTITVIIFIIIGVQSVIIITTGIIAFVTYVHSTTAVFVVDLISV